MTFEIKGENFYLNDKKVFLNSGEIHYFRIERGLWETHLMAAREAGLTTVSTYVPWAWHEPEESVFDTDGTTCPERDLKGWLRRCQDFGLNCIVKPGPFILAEFRGAGLPDWFLNKYGDEIKMRTRKGDIVESEGVSFFNRTYLQKVGLWYDKIMPIIRDHEISAGGPIIMMQLCNEIGLYTWLTRQADYGNKVKDRFISYLLKRFAGIKELNQLWGTDYKDFENVELPPDSNIPYASNGDRSRDHEWHRFWRSYYGDYLKLLSSLARDRGVTVPFYHNLPGWIYGHGYEFPVNITMYEDLYGDKSEILFGIDHIPEFMSYRNMHDDRIINDITHAMQGDKPLFAAEFQSGSREYHVVSNPRELELFYKTSIANGLTGWNYYMFSQGRNPRHKGHSGEIFYWFTPLDVKGERSASFSLVKRMSSIIKTSEKIIVEAKRKAEICVLFYPPYYSTEIERPEAGNSELLYIPSAIRRAAYFDGLLKALQVLNIDYDMMDLTRVSADDLSKYKQVWAFCTDEMNAGDQQKIVHYTKAGGNCVVFPYLPDRDLLQRSCTVIRDAISIAPSGEERILSPLIDIFDLKDIKCSNPQITYSEESLSGAEIIARTLNGAACGFSKALGKGSLIHLGTWIGFDTEEHKPVYESILKRSGARLRQASSENDNITVRERFTKEGEGILFIGNFYNEEQMGKVTYTHPETGETVTIPGPGNEMLWPPLYGVITPLCLEISHGLKILHCTSDILGIEEMHGQIEIMLYGDRDLAAEIVFEGSRLGKIKSATVSGASVNLVREEQRITLIYHHKHKTEMTLTLNIS